MNKPLNIFSQETLPDLIRQSFFLKNDVEITPAIKDAFVSGLAGENFSDLNELTRNGRNDAFDIFFTHDIDWLNPAHPYSFLKYIYSRVNRKYSWYPLSVITQPHSLLRNIERLIAFEEQQQISSLFLIGASPGSMGQHDIRYTVKESLFADLVARLNLSDSVRIGLHSSYNACAKGLINKEKETLAAHTVKKINTHRSHFLNYDPDRLYDQLERAGIQYELGYGHAREVGFKNKFVGKFKPVHQKEQRAYNTTCIPLILMDNAFFFHPYKEVMNLFRGAIQQLKQFNGSACILFHPENMILKPELWNYYEEIIHICRQEGANLTTHL